MTIEITQAMKSESLSHDSPTTYILEISNGNIAGTLSRIEGTDHGMFYDNIKCSSDFYTIIKSMKSDQVELLRDRVLIFLMENKSYEPDLIGDEIAYIRSERCDPFVEMLLKSE